jgi:UDP-N-acetylglucosamine transferase subunit ALG13
MIFVTTGTQAPFNRLVKVMDDLAAELNGEEIIVQASGVNFETKNIKVVGFLHPQEYNRIFDQARLIISHAGMGSIVSALTKAKPIIVIPRKAALGEHRDDHQVDSARKMEALGYVPVAYDEAQLKTKIISMLFKESATHEAKIGEYASNSLVSSIRGFILSS